MPSSSVDAFMAQFPNEGLTFDDVSLVTQYADFEPASAAVDSVFSRRIKMHIPFVSAAMDTVTESDMAIAMALAGGIGVIHKNLDEDRQAEEVARVKKYLNGVIDHPVSFHVDMTLAELLAEKDRQHYKFSGFPVVDHDGKLAGILTARDMKFVTDTSIPLSKVMTTRLVTAPVGTTLDRAFDIMVANRVGKLPLVDDQGRLAGLYSFHDVKSLSNNDDPLINRDEQFKLRVAAAVSPHDFQRIEKLDRAGVDAIVIDTAHGHSKGVIDTVKEVKRRYDRFDVVAGNVATAEGGMALVKAGADAIKVGVGPGSICTTRVVCGVGIPQLTAIWETCRGVGNAVPVIADGGIKYSGDVPKALAVGAATVMMGSAFAGTQESPGEKILRQGRTYVVYRGMGSLEAMKRGKGSRERYGQGQVIDESKLIPQGVEGLVQFRGPVHSVLTQYVGGLRFSLGYCGARNLAELRRLGRFIRVSSAGLREAHPHDIKVVRDAPNYSPEE